MCHDGTCSNNYIIADPGITENNAIGSDKNVISDSNNAYLSMSPGFSCTRIVCKYPYIAGQHNIVSNRNQPWPICIYRIAAVILKVFSGRKSVSEAVVHCSFLRRCSPQTDNFLDSVYHPHIISPLYSPIFSALRTRHAAIKLLFAMLSQSFSFILHPSA